MKEQVMRTSLLLLVVGFLLGGWSCESGSGGRKEGAMPDLTGKRVVMVIAHSRFRDEELLEPKAILEGAGASVTIACSSLEEATGMLGATVKPNVLLSDVSADGFDAVVFVGGAGASEYFNDATAHALARDAAGKGKVVAAICIAPSTLANAGLLQGKRATCWSSEADNLKARGADYTGATVERDGLIITGQGPKAAREFGQALAQVLAGQ